MYALSLFFLISAVASLLAGFQRGSVILVFASIAASIMSVMFLGAHVLRSRSKERARLDDAGPAVLGDLGGRVVARTDRHVYHRGDCRHAQARDHVEILERGEAAGRGYRPCQLCRPDEVKIG